MEHEGEKAGRFEDDSALIISACIKTVERLLPIHEAQALIYLRLNGNFGRTPGKFQRRRVAEWIAPSELQSPPSLPAFPPSCSFPHRAGTDFRLGKIAG
jgi:hypothetical protein